MAASTEADLRGNKYGHLPWRSRVITFSTASTATYFLATQESGAIFQVPTVSTVKFSLPRISSNRLGLCYEFWFSSGDAIADYTIDSTIDSSAAIRLPGATSGASTVSAIQPASTVPSACRVTAISTIVWAFENLTPARPSSANTSDYSSVDFIQGEWFTASTV